MMADQKLQQIHVTGFHCDANCLRQFLLVYVHDFWGGQSTPFPFMCTIFGEANPHPFHSYVPFCWFSLTSFFCALPISVGKMFPKHEHRMYLSVFFLLFFMVKHFEGKKKHPQKNPMI